MDKEKVIKDLEEYRDREFVKEGITVFDNDPRYRKLIIGNALAMLKKQDEIIKELQNAYGYLQDQFFDTQDKLLKEQEAVEPTIDEYGRKRCGSCGHKLQSIADPDLFCCKCGKPVLWEGR